MDEKLKKQNDKYRTKAILEMGWRKNTNFRSCIE